MDVTLFWVVWVFGTIKLIWVVIHSTNILSDELYSIVFLCAFEFDLYVYRWVGGRGGYNLSP